MDGFLYHTWAESRIGHRWIAVDPTFRQLPADATHIKLMEGEKPSDLIPLVDFIGKVRVEVIRVEKKKSDMGRGGLPCFRKKSYFNQRGH